MVSIADRGLADGAVADDQLALAAAKGEQRVDDDKAGLNRLGHQIAVDDRRRRPLDRLSCVSAAIGPLPSSGRPSGSTDAAEQSPARPARARRRRCRARYRRPRSPSTSSSRTQPMRSRSSTWAKPNWPFSKRNSSSSRTSGRPETSATPSPISSTRPICSACGPSAGLAPSLSRGRGRARLAPGRQRSRRSWRRAPRGSRSRSARQLLLTHEMRASQFQAGDQRGIGFEA